jgi:hypothetical protein
MVVRTSVTQDGPVRGLVRVTRIAVFVAGLAVLWFFVLGRLFMSSGQSSRGHDVVGRERTQT